MAASPQEMAAASESKLEALAEMHRRDREDARTHQLMSEPKPLGYPIGGPFTLDTRQISDTGRPLGNSPLRCQADYHGRYVSARSALTTLLMDNLYYSNRNRTAKEHVRIFIPTYTCPSLIKAVIEVVLMNEHCSIQQYHGAPTDYGFITMKNISHALSKEYVFFQDAAVQSYNFVSDGNFTEHDILIFNNYFGFQDNTLAARLGEVQVNTGMTIIQDMAQDLYRDPKKACRKAWQLYSPRKFLGLTDGGILRAPEGPDGMNYYDPVFSCGMAAQDSIPDTYRQWYLQAIQGLGCGGYAGDDYQIQYQFMRYAEEMIPTKQGIRMTDLTDSILKGYSKASHEQDMRIRRENYQELLKHLEQYALIPYLDEDTVPMGFPICVENLQGVSSELYAQRIYPMHHWPLTSANTRVLPADNAAVADTISKHTLTLPCDQRYNVDDMERVARAVLALM